MAFRNLSWSQNGQLDSNVVVVPNCSSDRHQNRGSLKKKQETPVSIAHIHIEGETKNISILA